jgi:hypothetical protein
VIKINGQRNSAEKIGDKIMQGLKDHQIQELTNAIRDKLRPLIPHQCLREMISSAALKYLEEKNLRIDKK